MKKVSIFLVVVTLIVGMTGCGDGDGNNLPPSENLEIQDWYDLNAVRDNLAGNYTLMNDLDSTTAGYTKLASPTANGGKGWQPIGSIAHNQSMELVNPFIGTFDGQGYEIRDLFIDRPDEFGVGLFGAIEGGVIKNVEVMNANVTGCFGVGILVGESADDISNSCSSGSVTGDWYVGGLVGLNDGTVDSSYSTVSVTSNLTGGGDGGSFCVGGLVGLNDGTVDSSYSTGSVSVNGVNVGSLVGVNYGGTVSNSYSTGSVSGTDSVGGLVGTNAYSSNVSDSYSSTNVTGYHDVGGLVGYNFDATVSNSYSTGSVSGHWGIGGLVGHSDGGTVSNCNSNGSVSGNQSAGGLVGWNDHSGTVTNSYSIGSVSGNENVGGLVGYNHPAGTVSNSFWDTETSGQATSDGGTGKDTTEMQNIATFSDATWDIVTVTNLDMRNPAYIWNIVNYETYPFLSWQLIS